MTTNYSMILTLLSNWCLIINVISGNVCMTLNCVYTWPHALTHSLFTNFQNAQLQPQNVFCNNIPNKCASNFLQLTSHVLAKYMLYIFWKSIKSQVASQYARRDKWIAISSILRLCLCAAPTVRQCLRKLTFSQNF